MERVGATGAKQLVLSQAPSCWCFFRSKWRSQKKNQEAGVI